MKTDLARVPPEERRIILVASDARYEQLREGIDWQAVAKAALFVAVPVSRLAVPLAAVVLGSGVAGSAYLAATFAATAARVRAQKSLFTNPFKVGEIPIPHLSPAEALRLYRFDLGVVEDGCAYVLNPVRPDYYLRPDAANERLAQEKLSAFLQLASSLGAREIAVTSGEQEEQRRGGQLGFPLGKAAAQLGLEVKVGTDRGVERTVVARFGKPREAPHVPDELRAWVSADPMLEGLSRTRLSGNVEQVGLTLSFRDQLDVGARACADLQGKGIQVGGKYRALQATRWSFAVSFWPRD